MKVLRAIALALTASSLGVNVNVGVNAQDDEIPPFSSCSADEYYADLIATKGGPANWTLADVADLLSSTQRNSLPSTSAESGGDDIYAALTDLDRGISGADTVLLLYRNLEVPSLPSATPQSWSAERLFPIIRGATRASGAANDVFNIKAGDTSVLLTRRGRLFYGECGTVEDTAECVSPATEETAADTAVDGKIITPPADRLGDVARSLFYMAVRYESLGLFLVDCPPFDDGEFGYRTPLLEWHAASQPTAQEIARNDQACVRWQGNRNPFIDYPELVAQFFGTPDFIRQGTKSFSQCLDATDAPTATPNACSAIKPGDAMVFLQNSDEPDQVIFFPLAAIPETVGSLYLTDNAYLGDALATNEGTVEVRLIFLCCCLLEVSLSFSLLVSWIVPPPLLVLTHHNVLFCTQPPPQFNIPEGGIEAGIIFGYGEGSPYSDQWEEAEGLFDLSVGGDQLFLYCLDADELPHFITGFSFNGDWADAQDIAALDEVPLGQSALPEDLFEFGSVALPHADNNLYIGTFEGTRAVLLTAFMNPVNYEQSNDLRYELDSNRNSGAFSIFSAVVATLTILPLVVAWWI
jgi:endonuclease I